MLNDYGYFLQETGHHKDAIKMMTAVLKVLPDRPPVYLNLADSLWATNQRRRAKQMYAKYKELSQKDHAKSIPVRVLERAGG
jgi:predicted Zn-dependent protease